MLEDKLIQEIRDIRAQIAKEYPDLREYWKKLQKETEDHKAEKKEIVLEKKTENSATKRRKKRMKDQRKKVITKRASVKRIIDKKIH